MMIHHYTVGSHIATIEMCGALMPINGSPPIVWFTSTNPWSGYVSADMHLEESITIEKADADFGGAYRYSVLDGSTLARKCGISSWDVLKIQIQMDHERRAMLARLARIHNTSVLSWYGTIQPIPIEWLRKQRAFKVGDEWLWRDVEQLEELPT